MWFAGRQILMFHVLHRYFLMHLINWGQTRNKVTCVKTIISIFRILLIITQVQSLNNLCFPIHYTHWSIIPLGLYRIQWPLWLAIFKCIKWSLGDLYHCPIFVIETDQANEESPKYIQLWYYNQTTCRSFNCSWMRSILLMYWAATIHNKRSQCSITNI